MFRKQLLSLDALNASMISPGVLVALSSVPKRLGGTVFWKLGGFVFRWLNEVVFRERWVGTCSEFWVDQCS